MANITLLSFQTPALETSINPNTQQNISYKWFMGVCSKQIVVLQRLFRALALVQSDLEHQLFTANLTLHNSHVTRFTINLLEFRL